MYACMDRVQLVACHKLKSYTSVSRAPFREYSDQIWKSGRQEIS